MLVVIASLLVITIIITIIILMGYIYSKRQLNYFNHEQASSMEKDTFADNRKEHIQKFDLDHFNIENFDLMSTWERNAHLWIDQQILSIKNENYKE